MTAPAHPEPFTDLDLLRAGDQLIWTRFDGTTVYITVTRVDRNRGITHLRCHHGDRAWTRHHPGPLFPSMRRGAWTAADLLDQL